LWTLVMRLGSLLVSEYPAGEPCCKKKGGGVYLM
jgi:hypothetical protein